MREDQEVHQFINARTGFVGSAGDGDSLEGYFSERLLSPLIERDNEAGTNKEFHMGDKSFEYLKTLTGDEPVINFPTES